MTPSPQPTDEVMSQSRGEKAPYVAPKILWEQEFVALAGCSTIPYPQSCLDVLCCDPNACDGCP